jgi:DNA-directed RNA polymerase specialized sigma24 family protein
VEGLEQDQASEALSVPVGTIKSRLFRGRRMLRETLLSTAHQLHLIA